MQFQSQALNKYLANALRPGEKVIWRYENAGATIWYMSYTLYGIIFLTAWCAFLSRAILSSSLSADQSAILLSFPFLIGFAFWFFCLWMLLRRKRYAYVVTDQRVFILNSFWPIGARVFGPDQVQSMLRIGTPHKGTIKLSSAGTTLVHQMSAEYYSNLLCPAKLVIVPDPGKVEKLIYDNVAGKINTMPTEEATGYKAVPNRKPNLFHGD